MDRTSHRTRTALWGALTVLALAAAACSGSSGASSAPASAQASAAASAAGTVYEVKAVQDPKLGSYLTGEDGKTLYVFTKDSPGKSACTGQCATNWPPFTLDTGETVKAGDGVTGTFSTITRDDGKNQVTYAGLPLYYFAKDTKAGDTTGQGVGGVWFVASVGGGTPSAPASGGTSGGRYGSESTVPSAAAAGTTASIIDFGFSPSSITIKVGSSVTWTNTGNATHTVTADDGSFDSGSVTSGATFSHTFATAGTFAFHCAIHPGMKGTVVVQ